MSTKEQQNAGFTKIENRLVNKGIKADFEIIFEAVVGSVAYGTNTPESDIDIKGVFIQPLEHQLLYGKVQQIIFDADTVYYEVSRLLELCSIGNPTMLELLFMPERCIQYASPLYRELLMDDDTRRGFITQHCRNSFCGYAYQQISKAKGLNKKMNYENGTQLFCC